MNITKLVSSAVNKDLFLTVESYIAFCASYLEYVETGLQARIISKNENHYQFFQYQNRWTLQHYPPPQHSAHV